MQISNAPPNFAQQPADTVVGQAGNARFSVLASGPGPLTYQWLSNGVPIIGGTSDVLTLSDVVPPPNLVSNGGFETPLVMGSYAVYAAGQIIDGWTVESNKVDLVETLWAAADGAQSVDLNGAGPGAIYQDVPTVPGQQYYLHFALAGNLGGGPAVKTNEVWWNGSLLDTLGFTITGHSATDMCWTNLEYLVTATNTTTRIRFASVVAGNYGPVVDAVTLEAVPPPPAVYSVIVSNNTGSITSSVAQVQFDLDGNGLPDSWERTYFASIGQSADADSDGDGVSNGDEYREGTDPTDAASYRPRLNLLATPGGSTIASPFQASYALNDPVQISATTDSGYRFARWAGDLTNLSATVNLSMDGTKTITAIFGLEMTSGGNYDDTIGVGQTNIYAFTATNGDNVLLRLGTVGFNGSLSLYDVAGNLLKSVVNHTDDNLAYTVTNNGIYLVVVGSYAANGTGSYRLHYARIPASFMVPVADEGGSLSNGASGDGAIDLGDLDLWTLTATNGDNIQLRLGTAGFNGNLNLYGPDGSLLKTAGNSTADILSYTATNSGSFTVVVSSYPLAGTGTYRLYYAKFPGAIAGGEDGGPLTNGANQDATIDVADMDLWTFTATNGDNIVLRVGELVDSNNFEPMIQLYGPEGALIGSSQGYAAAEVAVVATNTGSFTVVVSSYTAAGTGAYRIHLAHSPGTFVVSPGDEGGVLTNGADADGTIDTGDLDLWSFHANAGDNILLRIGEMTDDNSHFDPWIRLFGPDGAELDSQSSYAAAEIAVAATNTGTFTVVVADGSASYPHYVSDTGTYRLRLTLAPESFVVPSGADGGELTNGVAGRGTIDVGGLDMWKFNANAGDNIVLRIGEITDDNGDFDPWIRLFGPDGALLDSKSSYAAAEIALTVTNSGTFMVAVADGSASYPHYVSDTGTYQLELAQVPEPFVVAPGADGGSLANGGTGSGTIDTGSLNLWRFDAQAGDNIILRIGEATDDNGHFDPWIRLFGPDGALLDSKSSYAAAEIAITATNNGTFTVVVGDGANSYPYYLSDSGTYRLYLAQSPETFVVTDDGATQVPAGTYNGTISTGDLDLWGIRATIGDQLTVQVAQATDDNGHFDPWIRLYNPAGTLLASASGTASAQFSVTATNTGAYLVVVSDAGLSYPYYISDTGTYNLTLSGMTGMPVFFSFHLAGSQFEFGGSGGPTNGPYVVLTSTNLMQPADQWTPLTTNFFDSSGAFQITNHITPGGSPQFFRLVVP